MKEDPDMASAVAAIRTLLEFLKRDKGETIQGLRANLTSAIETLCGVDSSVAVSSGGELFLRFISLTSLEYSDYSKCKKIMIERGELFLRRISLSRNKIADLCHTFIKDGARILTHAYSRVVLRVLEAAVAAKKRFSVYITESQPDLAGKKMAKALSHLNVPVTVVLDAAVGYIMEKVDLVIVGAEGVVENGGIINKVGARVLPVPAPDKGLLLTECQRALCVLFVLLQILASGLQQGIKFSLQIGSDFLPSFLPGSVVHTCNQSQWFQRLRQECSHEFKTSLSKIEALSNSVTPSLNKIQNRAGDVAQWLSALEYPVPPHTAKKRKHSYKN
ncbi:translation initiation factor eIF2B subunit alpha isoform 2-T2 [Callospermophilus lateralis]